MEYPALPHPAGPAITRVDLAVAVGLALVALALYAGFGLRLAQGRYFEFYNLAFDFDPPRYVALLAQAEFDRGNVKHPLTLLMRPLAWPMLAAGIAPKAAAALVMAGFAAATVVVVFLFQRSLAVARGTAIALTALFAVSGCQVFTAMIPEAYGPAAFGIAAVWLLAVWRLADLRHGRMLRFALAVFSYGVTVTNLLQPVLAEALAWWRHRGLRGAVRPMLRYGLAVGALCAVLTALVWADVVWTFLADPAAMVKEVYWQRTKGERVGLVDVLLRLVGYGVVSPRFVSVVLPDGITMLDFRAPDFGPLAALAFGLWQLFWLVGAIAAFRHPPTRWLALGLAATLVLNIVFHLDFQFRGSIYLYAAHTHFLVFALGAGLAPMLRPGSAAARGYLGVVLLLVVLVGAVTYERAAFLATAFDEVHVTCSAPCTEVPR